MKQPPKKIKKTPNEWLDYCRIKLGWAFRINLFRFPIEEHEAIMNSRKMTYQEFNDTVAY